MCFRLMLAGLHYNENSSKDQKKDAGGNLSYSVTFPKAKKGDYSLKAVREDATYGEEISE